MEKLKLTFVFVKKALKAYRNKILILFLILVLSLTFTYVAYLFFLIRDLPSVESLKSYSPPLLSIVLDKEGNKVGEFFKERRILKDYSDFPETLIQAFVSAEDGRFFEHKGLNFKAIFRAFLANIRAGKKVQGGSTITQQVARSLLLSSEKTYKRKLKEAILALRIEKNLSKKEILHLYLNQIYLGHGAYGVAMAGEIYFRKKVKDLNLAESSLLAGLPQAPSRFSPIYNPKKAKERQIYVLQRMVEEAYIDQQRAEKIKNSPLKVFVRGKYHEKAPYYLETVRQLLLQKIDEELLLTGGLTIKTAIDLPLQEMAKKYLKQGLRELDKRQGFRGPLAFIKEEKEVDEFFKKIDEKLIEKRRDFRIISPLGEKPAEEKAEEEKEEEENLLKGIKPGEIFKAWVKEVDDEKEQVLVRLPFKTYGVLTLENMKWARKPDPKVSFKFFSLKKPSLALKKGDIILVKVKKDEKADFIPKDFISKAKTEETTAEEKAEEETKSRGDKQDDSRANKEEDKNLIKGVLVSLEQEPLAEAALIAFDQKTGDILAMVGGYDFNRSQFNRALQAERQTGSIFKPLVYLAALDKGFTPATLITDAPVVYEEEEEGEAEGAEGAELLELSESKEEEEDKTWKPDNYGSRFSGDVLFRNALIRSMNVPTVKVIEKIGVKWVSDYARRLGIFSPLNPDYTLALGSSSVTLYEMTKVFSVLGRGGKKISPLLLYEVRDQNQEKLLGPLSLDERFFEKSSAFDKIMQEKREAFLSFKKKQDSFKEKTAENSKNPKNPVGPDTADTTKTADTAEDLETAKDPDTAKPADTADTAEDLETAKDLDTAKNSFFFSDPDQLISEQTAFIMTTLLKAVIREPQGTGYRAREMDWPIAGKTGTTNGYYDAWFLGYSPEIALGVWLGFDDEKSLGIGETGARTALPIWLNFMKFAHANKEEKKDFKVPEDIIFTHIDNESGSLVTPISREIVHQAFVKGTQPKEEELEDKEGEDQNFLREDFSK